MKRSKHPSDAVRIRMGFRKHLSTYYDEKGRVCTSCAKYRKWQDFVVHKRSASGRAAICTKCKLAHRKSKGRNIKAETRSASALSKFTKKNYPFLYRSRNLRNSLLSRARKLGLDKSEVPSTVDIEAWFRSQVPLKCYYSGVEISILKLHVDHKQPLNRGGGNSLDNLCVTAPNMNSSKGAMSEKEFKSLLKLVSKWEDKGRYVLARLRMGYFG